MGTPKPNKQVQEVIKVQSSPTTRDYAQETKKINSVSEKNIQENLDQEVEIKAERGDVVPSSTQDASEIVGEELEDSKSRQTVASPPSGAAVDQDEEDGITGAAELDPFDFDEQSQRQSHDIGIDKDIRHETSIGIDQVDS